MAYRRRLLRPAKAHTLWSPKPAGSVRKHLRCGRNNPPFQVWSRARWGACLHKNAVYGRQTHSRQMSVAFAGDRNKRASAGTVEQLALDRMTFKLATRYSFPITANIR